jgi:type I restriction enzyme M protein
LPEHLQLVCPIRGVLKTSAKQADGLKPSEEYFRVEAIKYLLKMGYPKEQFKIEAVVRKFGNSGKNSLRADFAVLDTYVGSLKQGDANELLKHAVLLCEVKRDNAKADYTKHTQVQPLLDFAKKETCLGLYWDDVEQRIFWNEWVDGTRTTKQGPLAFIPKYGRTLKVKALTFEKTTPSDNLIAIFDRIEDLLHTAAIDPEQRFQVMLQLLLAKLFDEHQHASQPSSELAIQDFRALGMSVEHASAELQQTISQAVSFYQKYLPNKVSLVVNRKLKGDLVFSLAEIIAPIRLTASKREVIQSFYMRFAKGLYKWDLAQYFTPPPVTDYIVDILNPQFGEHLKDPACGSADFLTAAFHKRRDIDPGYAQCVWGADNSPNAVHVAILNMLLNGDGKTNIKEQDSLAEMKQEQDQYQLMVCNPPFGIKIQETRKKVLVNFDLGFVWDYDKGSAKYKKTSTILEGQETGMLFTELCVKQVTPGGRIGIILPNGYLGNRSDRYQIFREWILRHCRLAAICSFPRFTFKTSGADVSASVVYLEKRTTPLQSARESSGYNVSIQLIENVGWILGDKKALPRFVRDAEDGSYLIDEDGARVLDADFAASLADLRSSRAASDFPWLIKGSVAQTINGWSVPIESLVADTDLTMDPKRHCRKIHDLQASIIAAKHFKLTDLVDILAERRTTSKKAVKIDNKGLYAYVELQDIGYGYFDYAQLRGWQLPQRAKHLAETGDIYIGAI